MSKTRNLGGFQCPVESPHHCLQWSSHYFLVFLLKFPSYKLAIETVALFFFWSRQKWQIRCGWVSVAVVKAAIVLARSLTRPPVDRRHLERRGECVQLCLTEARSDPNSTPRVRTLCTALAGFYQRTRVQTHVVTFFFFPWVLDFWPLAGRWGQALHHA